MSDISKRLATLAASAACDAHLLVNTSALLPHSVQNPGGQHAGIHALISTIQQLLNSKQVADNERGYELLAVLLQSCPISVVVETYSQWLNHLIPTILAQQHEPIHVAAANATCVLLSRLSHALDAAGVRREVSTALTKLLPLCLKTLNHKNQPDAGAQADVMEVDNAGPASTAEPSQQGISPLGPIQALSLLQAVLKGLPLVVRPHVGTFAEVLAGRFVGGLQFGQQFVKDVLKAFMKLPLATGTAESWGSTLHQLLWSVVMLLDNVFDALEPDGAKQAGARVLDSEAQSMPLPTAISNALQGAPGGPSGTFSKAPSQGPVSSQDNQKTQLCHLLSCVLEGLNHMLGNSFPTAVGIPVRGIVTLAGRVLRVTDGSSSATWGPASMWTASQMQIYLFAMQLQPLAYNIMGTLVGILGGAVLPHMGALCAMLGPLLRAVPFADVANFAAEMQLYKFTEQLVVAGGVLAGHSLAADILTVVHWRLYGALPSGQLPATQSVPVASANKASGDGGPKRKKAKRGTADVEIDSEHSKAKQLLQAALGTPAAVNAIALDCQVLRCLSAVLSVAAPLLPVATRLQLEATAFHFATATAEATQTASCTSSSQAVVNLVPLQLAAYRCLLVSLQCPSGHRAPFFSQSLPLFRQGLRHADAQIREHCTQALLGLEPVLHPRGLPRAVPLDTNALSDVTVVRSLAVFDANAAYWRPTPISTETPTMQPPIQQATPTSQANMLQPTPHTILDPSSAANIAAHNTIVPPVAAATEVGHVSQPEAQAGAPAGAPTGALGGPSAGPGGVQSQRNTASALPKANAVCNAALGGANGAPLQAQAVHTANGIGYQQQQSHKQGTTAGRQQMHAPSAAKVQPAQQFQTTDVHHANGARKPREGVTAAAVAHVANDDDSDSMPEIDSGSESSDDE